MMDYNDLNLDFDIRQRTKELIEESGMIKYTDSKRIEQLFENIHIFETEEELQEKQGIFISSSETIEGFSIDRHIFVGPEATPHTIIREILRELSTQRDENGTVTCKGIIRDERSDGEQELNNGLIEYLSTKVSGEYSKYHDISKTIFAQLETIMIDYSKNPNILMRTLLKNSNYVHNFMIKFAKLETAYQLLHGVNFMANDDILDKYVEEVKKNYHKYTKIEQFKSKIKRALFPRKRKALIEGKTQISKNANGEWRKGYEVNTESKNNNPVNVNSNEEYKKDEGYEH